MDIKTICIHGSGWKDPTGYISVPVFQSATFGHPELGQSTGYDYARVQNPTRECTEKVVARLEHGCDCTSYSSGMAVISMVMELFKPGDTILSTDDLYGGGPPLFPFFPMSAPSVFSASSMRRTVSISASSTHRIFPKQRPHWTTPSKPSTSKRRRIR